MLESMDEKFYRRFLSFCKSLDALAEARQRDLTDSFVLWFWKGGKAIRNVSVPYGTGTMTQLVPQVVQGVEGQGGGLFIVPLA